jgi:hypothetical protein
MYFIKLKTDFFFIFFFKGFENSTAFSFNNIVILLSFILKTAFIARRMSIFINYLKKRRFLFF